MSSESVKKLDLIALITDYRRSAARLAVALSREDTPTVLLDDIKARTREINFELGRRLAVIHNAMPEQVSVEVIEAWDGKK